MPDNIDLGLPNLNKKKPHRFRDRGGRFRPTRLIEKKQRFRKRIEEPADSRNNSVFLGRMNQFRWIGGNPAWNPNPIVTVKTATWNGTPSKVERIWDYIHPGPPYPTGDDMTRVVMEYPLYDVRGSGSYSSTPVPGVDKFRYDGGFVPSSFTGDFLSVTDMLSDSKWGPGGVFIPEGSVASMGTDAFLRSLPKVNYAKLAEFVGEAGDIPHQFKTSAHGFAQAWVAVRDVKFRSSPFMPKEAGEHFLNHQFGWVPFVHDLQSFIDTTVNIRKRILDVQKVNNTWVRTRRRLVEDKSITVLQRGFTMNVSPSGFQFDTMQDLMTIAGNSCRSYYELQQIEEKSAWSVGEFKIYRPEFDDTPTRFEELRRIRRLLTLYGANINPSVLWELTPWSWLIDYFTNIGKLVETLTRIEFDSAAAREFFIMQETHSIFNFMQSFNWNSGPMRIDWPRNMWVKLRRKADNPFSFRSTVDLTSMQLAILAALGLSRGK